MPLASCHRGAVSLRLAEEGSTVTDCNGSICRRHGVPWACCSPPRVAIVPLDAALDGHPWSDRSIEFDRCRRCGCVTHGSAIDTTIDRTGIDARLSPPEILARPRVRHLDGGTEKTSTGRFQDLGR